MAINLKTTPRCKHGMIPAWCAYCNKLPQSQVKATGRGVGRMMMQDARPMMVWHKPQEEAV